ncbi:branched-chain amino acid ABC transporter permease [Dactylosporangium sp. CA-139066]|uniref:branched-chain amino acid ABC transporter permease n=1 Tax=Dactylosporangium sp. CA-139066 TaxID=3239930 RepID=UPI003D91D8EE
MQFWNLYATTIQFGLIAGLFALSAHVTLWRGILSLASAPVAAVAGYSSLAFVERTSAPYELAVVLGGVVGAACGVAVGVVLMRLDSHWFALGTVALIIIVRVLAVNLGDVTGGTAGKLVPEGVLPWHVFLCFGLACLVFARIRRSSYGLAAEAIRRDPDVAAGLGVPLRRHGLQALALAGAIAGVAGVLFAGLTRFLSPDTFSVNIGFTMLAGVVLGGAYYWLGSVVGGFVFAVLPELLQSAFPHGVQLVNGALLLLVVLFMPNGLVDPVRWRRWRQRGTGSRPSPGDGGVPAVES